MLFISVIKKLLRLWLISTVDSQTLNSRDMQIEPSGIE